MSNTEYRITKKGQVTLPKAIRKHLGVSEGEAVRFEIDEDGDVVVKAEAPKEATHTRAAILERIRQANEKAAPHIDLRGMTPDEFIRFMRDGD
ncbi:MAG: AbrB/MazE/SpoVT family DNA-binding domain-containing protein [Hyphomonas sp.]